VGRAAGKRVVVVGGGITGLASALRLAQAGVRVTLIEGSGRVGGKLRTVDGWEAGAENFLMRDPAGGPSAVVRLIEKLGLAGELRHPAKVGAGLYVQGEIKPLPAGTMLGIPGPQADLTGIATVQGTDADLGKPVLSADVSVGELVRPRLGGQVVTRLIEPLLGGVYAGHADRLSVAATMPGLYQLLLREHTLGGAVARAMANSKAHSGGPIFGTVANGLSVLVDAVAQRIPDIRLGRPVRDLSEVDADAIVLAVPGGKARRLLPAAVSAELGDLSYASVALATMAYPGFTLPALSGFLVPPDENLPFKAATFFTRKWEHLDHGEVLVRVSFGRAAEEDKIQVPDTELIANAHAGLETALGQPLPAMLGARVDRWGGGLPQYAPGHAERVASARALLPETLKLAGAAYDGVGIAACVASGERAARELLEGWQA
jgi:oxygen-dependent protoporphyrinogen oxidase